MIASCEPDWYCAVRASVVNYRDGVSVKPKPSSRIIVMRRLDESQSVGLIGFSIRTGNTVISIVSTVEDDEDNEFVLVDRRI